MTSDLIILTVVVVLLWVSTLGAFGAFGYWLKKRIDSVGQAINHTEQTNRSVPSNFDHQTARRRAAMCMFGALMFGVGVLVTVLIISANNLPKDQFVGGIILTAIAGAIGSFLSLIGIIVKGIMDKLTQEEPRDENRS